MVVFTTCMEWGVRHGEQILYKKCASIHFYTRLICRSGRGGAGPYPSERRGTPWTGRQSITGPHRDKQPHTHSHSLLRTILETPINLTRMFLDGGRKPEYSQRTHAVCVERTHANSTQKGPQPGDEPGTLLLWGDGANHHTTMQPIQNMYGRKSSFM